jgi:hypothetical protein
MRMRDLPFGAALRTLMVALTCGAATTLAGAQTPPPAEWERTGFQPNRDYLRWLPFEHLDTLSGNVILTLPQLTLPGNAGRSLQFQLTYNANIATIGVAPWAFGIAGVPMRVDEQATPGPGPQVPNTIAETWGITPLLHMADGGTRRTMFIEKPSLSTQFVITSDFWRYDRLLKKLYLPNGRIFTYAADPDGRLSLALMEDAFGNTVSLQWTKTGEPNVVRGLHVVQSLGGGSERVIDFIMNGLWVPTDMTYLDRTWHYYYDGSPGREGELSRIEPPGEPRWMFEYYTPVEPYRRLQLVKTPNGGEITYHYTQQWLTPTDYQVFLGGRTIGGRDVPTPITPPGQDWPWEIAYAYAIGSGYSAQTVVTTPSARLTYTYGPVADPNEDELIDGAIAPTNIFVEERLPDNSFGPVESEDRSYQHVGVIDQQAGSSFDGAELEERVIWRGERGWRAL